MASSVTVVQEPEKFMNEAGLVYHINRTILNPLGLALTLLVPDEGVTDQLHIKLTKTDDPDGFRITEDIMRIQEARWQKYLVVCKPMLLAKAKRLGFMQQPVVPLDEIAP